MVGVWALAGHQQHLIAPGTGVQPDHFQLGKSGFKVRVRCRFRAPARCLDSSRPGRLGEQVADKVHAVAAAARASAARPVFGGRAAMLWALT